MSRRTTPSRKSRKSVFPAAIFYARVRFWEMVFEAVDAAVERWLVWVNRPRVGDTKPGTGTVTFRPREHFQSNGKPKAKRTLADAQAFCVGKPEANFYRCSVCDAYHVGHIVTTKPKYPAILTATQTKGIQT